jgi:type I restriction enzyme S subunit
MTKGKNVPVLRFRGFEGEWKVKKMKQIVKRVVKPVKVVPYELYQQIGIRSHGKGLFYKEPVTGTEIGDKRVFWIKANVFIVNIVFAWEQAVAKTTTKEVGMIASHRFPMYEPIENVSSLDFILWFFLGKRGKFLLELASPGGAGRNKTLGQQEFEKLSLPIPIYSEQQKIASFLTAIDTRLQQLMRKKELLEQYKKGVMQRIFSMELRFKNEEGKEFSPWQIKPLGDVAEIIMGQSPPSNTYNNVGEGVFLIQGNADIEQRKSKPRNWTTRPTKLCKEGDILLSVRAPVGSVAQSVHNACIGRGVSIIRNSNQSNLGYLYQWLLWFEPKWGKISQGSTFDAISGPEIKKVKIQLPSLPEQQKIATFLTALDARIALVSEQLERTRAYKRGLLQRMFV